jgi:hypothetical protein
MARGYLGKISAIVSANTGSYVRGLNESAARTRDFAREVQSTLRRASSEASKSIQSIYTPLQQFERALQNASSLKLSFKGFPGAIKTVEELQASLAKLKDSDIDIAVRTSGLRSLDELKRTISQISSKDIDFVRNTGGLDAVKRLRAELGSVDNFVVKTEVKVRAEQLDAVIEKFAVIGDKQIDAVINVVGERQLEATLLKERQLRSIADGLSAPLSDAVSKFAQLSTEVQAAFVPALSRAQTGVQNMTDEAEAGVEISRRKFKELEEQVNLTTSAINRLAQANQLVSRLGEGGGLRDAAPRQFDALNRAGSLFERGNRLSGMERAGFGIAGQEDAVRSYARQIEQMRAMRERLAAEQSDTSQIDAAITRTTQRLEEEEAALERLIESAERYKKVQATEFVTFPGNATGEFGPPRPPPTLENFGPAVPSGFSQVASTDIGRDILDSQRQLERLRGSLVSVKSQVEALPASVQSRFIPAIRQAEQEFLRLVRAPQATQREVEAATSRLQRLEQAAKRAATAASLQSFGEFTSDASVKQATGELHALQKVLIQVGATANGAAAKAYEQLRERIARAVREGNAGFPQVRREIQRLEAAAAKAAAATGRISEGNALRQISRGGDIARAGMDKFSLAAQQAGFALDDFFSVTGGLDQRLRAVANNVSQLAFILGGTAGLFTALGVTIGAQLLIPLARFALNSKDGEDAAKGMTDALESQRDRVKQLADAYKELARSIAESGMSEGGRTRFSRLREQQDRRRQQEAIALDAVAGGSPTLAAARGAVAAADKALGEAATVGQAQDAARASRQARAERARQERLASARVRELADSTPINQLRQQRAATRDELARERARRQNSVVPAIFTLGLSTFLPGFSTSRNRENALRERLATQQGAISLSQQRQTEDFVTRGQRIAGRFAPFQENVQGFTATGSRIDSFLSRFSDTAQQIADGTLSGRGVDKATKQLESLAASLERAAIAVQGFSQVLDSQAGQLAATVASESRSREEQLRRDANAAEAQFGQNDPRAMQARRDEQQATEARRKTERDRLKVDEQISAERERFERDLLAGRGRQADRDRADEIRRQRAIADDENRSASDRERARLRVQRLEQEQAQSFESQPGVQRLRRQADELDIQNQRAAQEIESRQRGRELALSDRERTRREIDQSAVDLRNALPEIGAGGVQEAARNLVDQLAPAFAALRDEVLNARLQGPSRAALQVADINTAEGARELNRLMRGDDSARDVNLVELQKQTGVLEDIKTAIERETNVIVDL